MVVFYDYSIDGINSGIAGEVRSTTTTLNSLDVVRSRFIVNTVTLSY